MPGDSSFACQVMHNRIFLHAEDIASHGTLEKFCQSVQSHALHVTTDKVNYRFGPQHTEMSRYDGVAPEKFVLPRINGSLVISDRREVLR